jgi:cyclase
LLWNEYGCVKGRGFKADRVIGSMLDRVQLMERREVDELIILDIAATPNNRSPRFEEVKALTENLFMPVTIGGGIKSIADIRRLLECGADKVSIKTAALRDPSFIGQAAAKFGSQSIVVSIDVHSDQVSTAVALSELAERSGAGEILLTAIDRDGMMGGYDIDLIREVSNAVDIPVIACGGCGSYEHIAEVLHNTKAHAVGVGAAFQFLEMTPKGAARYLHEHGFQTRL